MSRGKCIDLSNQPARRPREKKAPNSHDRVGKPASNSEKERKPSFSRKEKRKKGRPTAKEGQEDGKKKGPFSSTNLGRRKWNSVLSWSRCDQPCFGDILSLNKCFQRPLEIPLAFAAALPWPLARWRRTRFWLARRTVAIRRSPSDPSRESLSS